ncbi:MAG: FecR domain-containing protein, partial [Vulcanimicrobiota bacterium]
SIRFFLGGNVGLGKGCEIEVINDRDAKILSQGNYWMKFDKQELKNNPVKIQTAGGVMGIRGTEFILKVDENGATELSLLEGTVEVEAADGERYEANPGERVSFGDAQGLRFKLYDDPEQLLQQVREELGPEFYQLRQSLQEAREAIREARLQIRTASAEARAGLVSARLAALEGKSTLQESGLSSGQLESALTQLAQAEALMAAYEQGEGLEELDEAEDSIPENVPDLVCSPHPSLKWPGLPEQRFAVLILHPQDDEQLYWMAETVGPQYTYPADARPLEPGPYTWRVVPLGPNGEFREATDFPIRVE